MKRQILLVLAIACTACSSDEAFPVTDNQVNIPDEPTITQEYKVFVTSTNIDEQDFTYKTKTGNGSWVEHQLQLYRFPVKYGDSVQIDSGNNASPSHRTAISLQINTVVDWYDTRNYTYEFQSTSPNEPINRKFKIEF